MIRVYLLHIYVLQFFMKKWKWISHNICSITLLWYKYVYTCKGEGWFCDNKVASSLVTSFCFSSPWWDDDVFLLLQVLCCMSVFFVYEHFGRRKGRIFYWTRQSHQQFSKSWQYWACYFIWFQPANPSKYKIRYYY